MRRLAQDFCNGDVVSAAKHSIFEMQDNRLKITREEEEKPESERCTKAKRYDFEVATSDFDLKLAQKLDSMLNINSNKPRFLMNKPKAKPTCRPDDIVKENASHGKMKQRNLTKEEMRQRLVRNHDTLVPELDSKRLQVKVVKVMSAVESMELGKVQARKQIERELELNSISGNQQAYRNKFGLSKSNDGHQSHEALESVAPVSILRKPGEDYELDQRADGIGIFQSLPASKSIRFASEMVKSDENQGGDDNSTDSDRLTDDED